MNDDTKTKIAKMWKREFYVMVRSNPDPAKGPGVLGEHIDWMIETEKAGHIFLSGPAFSPDGKPNGGFTILRAESFEEAEAIGSQDPFVTKAGVTFEVKRWQVNEGRMSLSVDLSDMTATAS